MGVVPRGYRAHKRWTQISGLKYHALFCFLCLLTISVEAGILSRLFLLASTRSSRMAFCSPPNSHFPRSDIATVSMHADVSLGETHMMPKRTLQNSTRILALFVVAASVAFAQSVSLTPASLTFPAESIGTTSTGQTVTLKNTSGTTALTITSLAASGDYITSTCPSSIAPGGSCVLTINFAPNAVGTINGAVTIVDNANPSPQVVSSTGTGLGPVIFAPPSLSFPATPIGSTSAATTA